MKTRWFKGLSQQDKSKLRADIMQAEPALARLAEMLQADLNDSLKDMAKSEHYLKPAWAQYQASKLGEQKTLRTIIELISERDTND